MTMTPTGPPVDNTPMPGARLPPQGAAAFVQSDAGDIRIGPILAIPQVLQDLGARPQTAFARAGVRLSLFRDPDARLPLEVAGRLFFESARLADCPHVALLVGERFSLGGLGPLGELMRHSPTVGAALRSLLLHLQLHDRGAAPLLLQTEPGTVVLGYSVYRHFTPGAEFIYDVAVTIGHRILLGLCGPGFAPQAVQFSYRRPARTAAYRHLFRAPLHFDAEVSGLVFASTWLAQQFGISQRTLRRRLDAEGKSFQTLVNRTRHELACQLLRNTQLPVTHIAAALQYADANAFSRAFRQWTGCTPTAWRAADG